MVSRTDHPVLEYNVKHKTGKDIPQSLSGQKVSSNPACKEMGRVATQSASLQGNGRTIDHCKPRPRDIYAGVDPCASHLLHPSSRAIRFKAALAWSIVIPSHWPTVPVPYLRRAC